MLFQALTDNLPPDLAGSIKELGPWALFIFLVVRHFFDGSRKALAAAVASLEQVTRQVAALERSILALDSDGLDTAAQIREIHRWLAVKDGEGIRRSGLRVFQEKVLDQIAAAMDSQATVSERQVDILAKVASVLTWIKEQDESGSRPPRMRRRREPP